MRDDMRENNGFTFNMQSFLQLIRATVAILGIIAIIIGLTYATRMFGLIYTTLQAPEAFQVHLDTWVAAVGGEELNIVVEGTTYPGARVVAIIVLGGGAAILAWIAMGFIRTGAKTVSWILGDREAVKKILLHAFGPAKQSELNTKSVARENDA